MSRNEKILNGVAAYAAYYRSNPHRFVKDYLHIDLRLFQKIVIAMMNVSTVLVFLGARGELSIASPLSNKRAISEQNR